MRRRHFYCIAILSWVVLSSAVVAMAQDQEDIQNGIKAYGTYRGGDIDSVSMTNGNLVIKIPLASYPQRGKVHLSYSLFYTNKRNSSSRQICGINGCTTTTTVVNLAPYLSQDQLFSVASAPDPHQSGATLYSVASPDLGNHALGALNSTTYESVDATGFRAYVPTSGSSYITDADGTRYYSPGSTISQEDANGNQIVSLSGGTLRDTVGRTIPPLPIAGTVGSGSCPAGPLPVSSYAQWVIPGTNGGTSTFLFCWAKVTVAIKYIVNADGDPSTITGNPSYLQSIVLPNGTFWTFQYSTDLNGDLVQVIFPTGGALSYVWGNGLNCTAMPLPARFVTSRAMNANDGTGNHTWSYTYSAPNYVNHTAGTTTVIDPLGNYTTYTVTALASCAYYTTSTQYYQGAAQPANLLKTVATTYTSSASPFIDGVMNVVPTQIKTTWAVNGKTGQVAKTYDSGFTFSAHGSNWTGVYGKVIAEKEYDYGTTSGQAGPLLKQTNTTFAWQSPNPNYGTYLSNNLLNLVYSTQITDGTNQKAYVQFGHDESAAIASGMGASQNLDTSVWTGTLRGNQTSINRWLNLPTVKTITSTTTYYDTGMASVAKDPLLYPTTYFYSSAFQDAYATQAKNALNQSVYNNYDYNTGMLLSTTDVNGQITSNSYDNAWRLTNVTRPAGGGQTSFCYSDSGGPACSVSGPPYEVVITKQITSTKNETATAVVDGLGRLAHTQLNSDPAGTDYVDDTYDAVGNKASSTNPYRSTSDSTYGTTTNAYDALHRVTQVTQADGSHLRTAYCANTTLVTDEAAHWRRSTVDGLGRLIEVDEPNSLTATVNSNGCPGTGEPIWVTTYGYDTLGNLTSVLQAGSRSRTFTYDSMSRLLSATNPESGILTYTYDNNGNVTTKVTPQQNQTNSSVTTTITYCYDSLNRLTAKGYGSTAQTCTNGTMPSPVATYSYDGSGCLGQSACYNISHRTGMTDSAGSEAWAYDAIGRPIVQSRTTNSISKTTNYTYNLDSSIATLQYPSGRVITYTPDTAGRPSSVQDNTTSVFYATGACANGVSGNGACFGPEGAVAQIQNGTSLISTSIYNKRLQPCWMYSTTGTPLAASHVCTDTASAANLLDLKYNFSLGSDNGNVISITNNRISGRGQSFSYDQLNRITTAQTTATFATGSQYCWGQAFGYDSSGNWGNLLSIAGSSSAYTGCMQGSLTVTVTAKNQISGNTYDAAGNLMTVPGAGGATYIFNAENQMTSTSNSSMSYAYDGDGNRVMKSGSRIYWYAGDEVLDETDTTGIVTNGAFNEYVFFGGKRIARRDSSNNVFYYLTDHLNTSRVIVQGGQTTACYDSDFEPFGGEHTYTNTCAQNYKFTGKERDSESGLDNFGARYYGSTTGRFMSPDWALRPVAVPYATVGDPQTLNLYTYAENSPLNRIDADGHEDQPQSSSNSGPNDASGRHAPTMCETGTTGGGTCDPQTDQSSSAQNKESNTTERIVMGIEGAANLYVAKEKAEIAVGLAVATPESGPAATAAGTGAALASISALSSGMTGTAQIVGAITGKTEEANTVADGLAASTSVSGVITTVVTNGDVKKAAAAASIEGIATSSFKRGIFKSGASIAEAAVNIIDLVSAPPAPPRPPVPGPPSTQ